MTRSDYLAFGGSGAAARLDPAGTLEFLTGAGFGNGPLEQARAGIATATRRTFEFEAAGSRYCDFCFAKLMGGEYDRLDDGRERCVRCSRTVVRTRDEFAEIFMKTRRTLEIAFEITIDVAMRIQMVNAREIARRTGETFVPTPGVDARVLGFATRSDEGYALNIENGSPALAAIATIAHELTHIWQFANWAPGMVETRYGAERRLLIAEGMATWAQIQYLLSIKEYEYAERQEAYAEQRDDAYGEGFRLFRERYPLDRAGMIGRSTPFGGEYPI
ncbi:MAG: hypothetical protein KDB25_00510 [Leucobacter sp.]|nr:hypothetical protein [Leucobacter sp.]